MNEHWVVVGAGSAGCVVAARLSEDGVRRVTLLDDGPDLVAGAVPPAIDGDDFFGALDESGRTHAGLTATRRHGAAPTPYRRGRGLGGSSAVNAMVALRGDPAQYRSWGWTDAEEMWRRIEIPVTLPDPGELGDVDRALLAADRRARIAPLTRRNGRRVTAAEAYVWPARDRDALSIRTSSEVSDVVFDGRRAVGVRLAGGEELSADRVVVAAGTIHSPALLLRSGVDTPGVGTGLQDHPSAPLTLQLRDGRGRHGLAVGALVHDAGVQLLAMNHLGPGADVAGLGLVMVALMTPHGRAGTVTLDPDRGEPVVDFGLLTDERDVAGLTVGVRRALDVVAHPAFVAIADEVYVDEHGTTSAALNDDDAIDSWVRSTGADYVHASSSCAMGTVVDEDGAVYGYDGLYVCDASVFPSIPDVNTHLPTTMLAERLSARWRERA